MTLFEFVLEVKAKGKIYASSEKIRVRRFSHSLRVDNLENDEEHVGVKKINNSENKDSEYSQTRINPINLGDIMWSELIQMQKTKYCILICGMKNSQTYRSKKWIDAF